MSVRIINTIIVIVLIISICSILIIVIIKKSNAADHDRTSASTNGITMNMSMVLKKSIGNVLR